MSSTHARRLAAVAGILALLTAACGGAVGNEGLLQAQDDDGDGNGAGAASSTASAQAPETPPRPSAAPEITTETAATCAASEPSTTRGPMCSQRVTVASFQVVRASCYVDTEIEHGAEGTLYVPCEGDGEATLTFGSMTFEGSIAGGRIDVCAGTEFVWQDGCTWTSAQRVSGKLSDGVLAFAYGEAPKAGESGCANACTANGSIHVP